MRQHWAILLLLAFATVGDCREKSHKIGGGDEDIAGPIVKSHTVQRLAVVPTSSANLTLLVNGSIGEEKKKTIAQIIDEALEQEFPEEKKEKIGKNYNETALQDDVSTYPSIRMRAHCFMTSMLCHNVGVGI